MARDNQPIFSDSFAGPASVCSLLATSGGPRVITTLGDSTGNDENEWVVLFVTWLMSKYPQYTVETRLWNDTKQGYDQPVLRQAGTAGLRRYVSSGASTDRTFVVADSVANSVVGDMTIEFQVKFGGLPGAAFSVCSKRNNGAPNVSWRFELNSNGTITLYWSADGTNEIVKSSTVSITSAMYNAVTWYRVKLDVDNGATQNEVKFYTSSDRVTWTQLGATVTTAAVTSVFDGNSDVIFNGRGGAQTQLPTMEFWRMCVYNGITDATMFPVVEIDTSQFYSYNNTLSKSFPEMALGSTVTGFTSTTGSFVGAAALTIFNGHKPGADFSYLNNATRFPLMTPVAADMVIVSTGYNDTDPSTYRANYKTMLDAIKARHVQSAIMATSQGRSMANATISASTVEGRHACNAMVPSIALQNNVGLIDVYGRFLSMAYADQYIIDGTHPTPAGSVIWADVVSDLFAPFVTPLTQ